MQKITIFFFVTLLLGVFAQTCPDQDGSLVNWSTLFASSTDVIIQASQKIKLDTTATINTLTINGTLVFDDSKNVNLTAHWIKVNPGGKLQIGSSSCPYQHKAIITFTGAYTNTSEMGTDPNGGALGTKGLAITSGATLELFGAVPTLTWTRLSATALANSTSITVEDAVSWSVGSQIVIASTDYSAASNVVPDQSEQNEIVSISGKTITLKYNLTYMHWADQEGWERAEVGLLTRNIVIQGDDTSDQVGFGGHMIIRKASSVHVQGAEFYRMGQKGILGRYPIHLHLMKDQVGKGFYASYNAIHRSYQRCVAIHDGQGLTVTNNVAFNITGHCYFLEDGPEQLNTFDHNLGVRVNVGALIPSDANPAVYWITNPNNTYTNNVAVGGAFGFWFSLPMHPVGASQADYATDLWVWPRYTPLATFDKNVGHSNSKSGLFVDDMLEPDGTTPLGSYTPRQGHYNYSLPQSYSYPSVVATFTNFIGYKCREHGVWTRGGPIVIESPILLDNTNAITCVPGPSLVVDALIVGETANIGTVFNYYSLPSMNRSRPVYYTNNYPVTGWGTYDNGGPQFARNITFKNFTTNTFRGAGAITTLPNAPFMLWATDKLEDLKFENANKVYLENFPTSYSNTKNDMTNGANLIDNDGSITGEYGGWIVSDTPFMIRDNCKKNDSWNAWHCPKFLEGYTQLRIDTPTWPNVSDHYRASWHLLGNASYPFLNVTGGGDQGSDFLWTVNLIPFRGYTIRWAEPTPPTMQVSLGGSTTKEWAILAIPYPSGTTFTITADYSNTKVLPVTSLDQLNSKYEYFYDSTTQHLYVFLQSLDETAAEIWNFSYHYSYNSFVNIAATCPGGSCIVGTPSYGTSSPSPALPPAPQNNLVYFRANMEGCRLNPPVDSSYEGVALGAFDPLTGLFTYNIYHTIKSKASRVYLGSGFNETAAEYLQLVGSKSPIKGSVYISQQKLNDLISGKLFVTIESTDHSTGELRGYFGCDAASTSKCQVSLTTTDPASFCSLPTNSSFVIYSDSGLANNWRNWTWGNATVLNFADTQNFVCGNSSMKIFQPGSGVKGQFQLGHSPVFAVDTNSYKYLSFFVKVEGSLQEELQLYVAVSNASGVWYPEYRIKRDDISSYAIDNAAWGQVLIDLKQLGLGSGNQTIYAMTISTHYWSAKQVTLYIDEIQFLPAYTRTTQNAVTATPTLFDGQSCKQGGSGTTSSGTGGSGSGESSAAATAVSLLLILVATLAML